MCVALELEYVDEEENANKDGIVIQEQAQDIADTTQPGNVDKTTEARRTSTRNKKNPSIRGKDFLWWTRYIAGKMIQIHPSQWIVKTFSKYSIKTSED